MNETLYQTLQKLYGWTNVSVQSDEYITGIEVSIADNDYLVVEEPDGSLSVQMVTEAYVEEETIHLLRGVQPEKVLALFAILA